MAVAIAEALPGGAIRPARPLIGPQGRPETANPPAEVKPGRFQRVLNVVIDELRPFEGRLGMSLRMVLSVVIVVVFMMSQQVPEAVLACYLVFFASRRDAGAGMLISLALIVAVTIGVALGLVVMQLSADDSMVRLLIMAGFAFGGMFLSQASRLGSLGATAGFVFVFALSLIDFLPYPTLISHALSWIWVVVALPMAVLFIVNMLFGPNPAVLARRFVADRLAAAAVIAQWRRRRRCRGQEASCRKEQRRRNADARRPDLRLFVGRGGPKALRSCDGIGRRAGTGTGRRPRSGPCRGIRHSGIGHRRQTP